MQCIILLLITFLRSHHSLRFSLCFSPYSLPSLPRWLNRRSLVVILHRFCSLTRKPIAGPDFVSETVSMNPLCLWLCETNIHARTHTPKTFRTTCALSTQQLGWTHSHTGICSGCWAGGWGTKRENKGWNTIENPLGFDSIDHLERKKTEQIREVKHMQKTQTLWIKYIVYA